jgi:Dimerisation domain
MSTQPSADRIEQVAFGFMASKVLFGAIEFGVFTELAKQPLDGQALTERLGLHPCERLSVLGLARGGTEDR